jgi:DNA-binding MurR/RpiR family transcriptional regulator
MNNNPLELIKQKYPKLSKSQKIIADYIINNKHKAINMVASDIAELTNTSESTVVRFAQELEYTGYPELISDLNAYIKPILTNKERLEILANNISNSNHSPVEYSLNTTTICFKDNVYNLKQSHQDNINNIIKVIKKANRVYLYGNKFLTQYVSVELSNINKWCIDLNEVNSSQLLNVNVDDIILVISDGNKDVLFNSLCRKVDCCKFLIADNCSNNSIDFDIKIILNKNIDDLSYVSADMLALVNVIISGVKLIN